MILLILEDEKMTSGVLQRLRCQNSPSDITSTLEIMLEKETPEILNCFRHCHLSLYSTFLPIIGQFFLNFLKIDDICILTAVLIIFDKSFLVQILVKYFKTKEKEIAKAASKNELMTFIAINFFQDFSVSNCIQ